VALLAGGAGEVLALTTGDQPYTLSPEGQETRASRLEAEVSETRTWGPENRLRLGVCLPLAHQILLLKGAYSRTTQTLRWPIGLGVQGLSAGLGQGPGELLMPLSFDVGPDGRIYVLDAGNARIQVFDEEGQYLTQWGRKGSAEGEFDFGSGRVPEDFAGSVAVDSEGYIYVADVGNRRIQKFAP
jgi:hypothetical protein